jgi:hypothetical protein
MTIKHTAHLLNKLMGKIGYKYYIAQGGDWRVQSVRPHQLYYYADCALLTRGSLVCRAFAVYHQDTCLGTHLNANMTGIPSLLKNPLMTLKTALGFAGLPGGYSKEEINALKAGKEFWETGSGYSKIQGTRPQV